MREMHRGEHMFDDDYEAANPDTFGVIILIGDNLNSMPHIRVCVERTISYHRLIL